ncbi:hypothetical protein NIES21_42130 [Anabaenopsis circularis NIES-21]|uniref:Uncharacterized protein n=1 Tax=Anabaenopsis circularis NIES-21 TaxID=1085406 RepID=A0A1Z4GLI9_9CYAN|nr:hypothetical protein NIES21_42130 [Anabaenopsis circularis NIES-21]
MTILEFLVAINGIGQLWAADRQFLGVLSNNQYDMNSISNPYGNYGGKYGSYSIFNPYGNYGSKCGNYSPYNIYCSTPPFIIYQEQIVLVVSKNANLQINGVQVLDPDLLISAYIQADNSLNFFWTDAIQRMF